MSGNSYAISVEIGAVRKPILTITIAKDGSIAMQDRIKLNDSDHPIYQYIQFKLPVNQVGRGRIVIHDGPIYFSKNKPKLSHHSISGKFHISSATHKNGSKIFSGITDTGEERGLGNLSTRLKQEANDGGPIMGGIFFGLNNVPADPIKKSKEILFRSSQIKDQTMPPDQGRRPAVVVFVFHFLKATNSLQYIDSEWARYSHHLYRRPVLIRVIDPGEGHEFLIGVACMSTRTNDEFEYGYRIGGGPGIIDPNTGTCLNTHVLFGMPSSSLPSNAICLDYAA